MKEYRFQEINGMDKSFGILQKIIQSANMRHKVIASNIANSDTPGYKARDVKFSGVLNNEVKLLTTDPKHIGSKNGGKVSREVIIENDPSWGDRNNVELDVEVAKMTENSLRHEAALRILNSKIRMYKSAIRGR
ncbi:MAG TPA: flagellar basal body rod protein FlgB [Nitrospiraceae bacterium]|nr:flagellar basal body rod protein FlgB [Nitrospiraceae bacterium]